MNTLTIHVISFGYGHAEPPTAELTYDLRSVLRNPHHDPAMRQATGLDQAVYDHVLSTPGVERLALDVAATARGLAEDTGRPVTVAFGCVGGRHRSVGLARRTHELLYAAGEDVTIEHRDVARDLLPPGAHSDIDQGDAELPEAIRYTADVVLLTPDGQVLLIKRGWPPHKGEWAFPGGRVDIGETSREAAVRELFEETGIRVAPAALRQVGVFDAPGRDPRGRYITVAYVATVAEPVVAAAGDDAADARWWPLAGPPALAFDHADILAELTAPPGVHDSAEGRGVDLLPEHLT